MNEPLQEGNRCPACGGTGKVSWLRSGAWINKWCPGRNGPVDDDLVSCVHELDFYSARRSVRIEYKRPNERFRSGQRYHMHALLDATRDDWRMLYLIIMDEGQTSFEDLLKYEAFFSWTKESKAYEQTVETCGKRIANWLWPEF